MALAPGMGPAPWESLWERLQEVGVGDEPLPAWDEGERWGCIRALNMQLLRPICQRVLRCQGGEASPDGDVAH